MNVRAALFCALILALTAGACASSSEPLPPLPEEYRHQDDFRDERISFEPEKEQDAEKKRKE